MPLAVLLAIGLAVADAPPQGVGARPELERDLTALTSSEAAGRLAGSAGDAYVQRYLVERMCELGLAVAPGAKGHALPFEVAQGRGCDPEATRLQIACGGDVRRACLELGVDAQPFAGSGDGDVRAGVVFAGYGLDLGELHDDYEGLDVEGKVVLLLRGAPDWPAALRPEFGRKLTFAEKWREARRRGAIGVLLCGSDPRAGGGPRELRIAPKAVGSAEMPAFWITRAWAAKLIGLSEDELAALQREAGRAPGVTIGRRTCGFARLAVAMLPPPDPIRTANVVGVVTGSDPDRRDEWIVVGAHYDHLGRVAIGSKAVVHPGADDNASGVTAMLEVARRLRRQRPGPARSVLFAALGGGELRGRGARHLLEQGPLPADRIVAMVNLDMVGRGNRGLRIEGVASGRGWRRWLGDRTDDRGLEVQLVDELRLSSDHIWFLRAKVPSLLLHTGMHEHYRRPTDLPCLVEVEPLGRIAALAADLVDELAQAPAAPFGDARRAR